MKFQCQDLQDALQRQEPETREALRRHLESCPACRSEAEWIRKLQEAAPTLRKEWESPLLWPRIERQLTEPSAVGGKSRFSGWRAFAHMPLQAWAAALFLLLISSAVLWIALHPGQEGPPPRSASPLLTEQALREVEAAESAYMHSIERLSALLPPRGSEAETPLTVAYREKLQLIDQAIEEIREGIETNRFNAHLRTELLSAFQEKQRTLMLLLQENRNEPQ